MAFSKNFHWVELNRDHIPDVVKRFNVSAYPSYLVLGKKQEEIHRFQSYLKPKEFTAGLQEGLRRYELYRRGEEWDIPNPRPAVITEAAEVETFQAPSEEIPIGITFLKGDLWVAQAGSIYRLDPKKGAVKASWKLPQSIRGICNDGRYIYLVEYGWTAGHPIHVMDPSDGRIIRTIVTEENKKNKTYSAHGITFKEGKLYVGSARGAISEVDPASGEVRDVVTSPAKWLIGLDWDGKHFVTASREALLLLNTRGEVVGELKLNYGLRCVAYHEGCFYAMEAPVFGFDKDHQRIRVWPKQTVIYKMKPKADLMGARNIRTPIVHLAPQWGG